MPINDFIAEQLQTQLQQENIDGMLVQPLRCQHCLGSPDKMLKKKKRIKILLKLQSSKKLKAKISKGC
jgi:hypothetical protein